MGTRDIVATFKEMYGADISATLVSKVTESVITKAIETIVKQYFIDDNYLANGMEKFTTQIPETRSQSSRIEEKFFKKKYDKFVFSIPERDNLSVYQKIISLAQQQNIDLHIVISPSHARQFETIAVKEIWDVFEHWKRQLVVLNESVVA
jgi:hypothetical protein